jgi:peptide/nickel transport system permease protein
MPRFWLGILFQVVFVVGLGLFPLVGRLPDAMAPPPAVTGLYTIDTLLAGQLNKFLVVLKHLTLPGIAIGLGTLAQVMRLIRSQTIEESREDYVMNARAFGLPQNLIAYKYILKNSFTSSLTILGLAFGLLLGNAFTVEIVFAWPGMARYGVNSILFQDFNGIMGVVMIVGVAYLTANFVVDLLYGYLDPRIRLGDGSNE